MNAQEDLISLYAVGDVCVNREKPESIFELASSTVNRADIAFCQLEDIYSDRGLHVAGSPDHFPPHPRNISALKVAGFEVVSMAGNHVMDYGVDALSETIGLLERNNIRTVGVGKNIAAARNPVIIINNLGQPEILTRKDKRSLEVFNYMTTLCKEFDTRLSFEGDEVLIHGE